MNTIIPMTEFRSDMYEIVKQIKLRKRHVILTKNGRAEAVVMSPEELETLEILVDTQLMRQLVQAERDLSRSQRKKFIRHEDLFSV